MTKPDLPRARERATIDDARLRDEKRAKLRTIDSASLAQMGKDVYAQRARLLNELRPLDEDYGDVCEVLHDRLVIEGRMALNDPDFFIGFREGKKPPPVVDRAGFHDALHALRIDGEPLDFETLERCAPLILPPPQPPSVKSVDLTAIKMLARIFGKPILDLIEKFVQRPPAPKFFVFVPKEGPGGNTALDD